MLAIRFQRTGRKGHAQFRIVVQDARLTPSSGRIVKHLGSYNPHTKATILNKELAAYYLEHGAQPSPRVVSVLKEEGVALPDWVKQPSEHKRSIKNADKLRRNQPKEEVVAEEAPTEAPAEAEAEATPAAE